HFIKDPKEIVKRLHESQPLSDRAFDLFIKHFATLSVETRALFQPNDVPVEKAVCIIDEPITTKELEARIKHLRGVTSLDVTQLTVDSDFSLDCFAVCPRLSSLTLRTAKRVTGILCFDVGIKSLTSLTLTNAPLGDRIFRTVQSIPLQHLCIDASTIRHVQDLRFLNLHPTLRQLDIKGVHDTACKRVNDTHVLLPNATVAIKAPHVDMTDYKNLFSKRRANSPFAINLQELAASPKGNSPTWTLDLVGADEDENWEAITYGSRVLKRNYCERLSFASPIKCFDKRVRVASLEPKKQTSIEAFWNYVDSDNVTFIAMVKEIERECYFPQAEGDELRVGTVSIECIKVEKSKYYTERVFVVNGKTVYHLQINWDDGSHIELDALLALLKRIQILEKGNPGSSIYHCKAGYGRTGALFGALIIKQALDQIENLLEVLPDLFFDPEILIRGLRQQRKNMIQNGEQLHMLFRLIQTLVKKIMPAPNSVLEKTEHH
ncbi:MAG: hypothetical protein LLF94_09030, partial [Chlamydiales bacterium]|nr:hypothetical protein [Chlamydiales bacterium]